MTQFNSVFLSVLVFNSQTPRVWALVAWPEFPALLGTSRLVNSLPKTYCYIKEWKWKLLSCDPMDYTVLGILQAKILEWVAFPSPGDLPNPEMKPGSLALQPDSLPTELSGKLSHKESPRILEWVAYHFSSRSSRRRNQTGVSGIAGGFFTNWALREAHSQEQLP